LFKFRKKYFLLALLLFIIEVIIALFINHNFVRPYFGDFLVVVLVYCFVKSFFDIPIKALALAVLLFAYIIEALQYFKFIKFIGLQKSKIAILILGSSFAWTDMIAYTLGIIVTYGIEKMVAERANYIGSPT